MRILAVFVMLGGGTALAQSPTVKPARVTTPPTIVFPTDAYTRTNRAIFTTLQYLFRYQS